MTWVVRKVSTPADLTEFLRLPRTIYRDYPNYVHPLEFERRKFLDQKKNPFFAHADAEHFLVSNGRGPPVGRITAVVDHANNEFNDEKSGFFGLFECIDDQAVADVLLNSVKDWCRQRGLDTLRGPMNLSINHECGLLIDGFDTPPIFGLTYNPPYYEKLIENQGLRKIKDLLSLGLVPLKVPDYLKKASQKMMKRGHFTVRNIRVDRFEEELKVIWDIYNEAWHSNWKFVPMTREEFWFAASEMKSILIPELCYIAEVKGQAAGFSLSLPDFNQTLIKINGKLLPFGFRHLLFGRKKADAIRTITLGVKPKYRRMGIDVVLYDLTYQWGVDHGIKLCDQSWLLEDNTAITGPIQRLGGTLYKRHRLYECSLNS